VMGRITGYTSPEEAVSYTYDANGNVLTVTDSHGTITRIYDVLNRVLSYTDTYGNMIRYEYDAVGNLSRLIYPDGTAVTYAYDANHNLIYVTDWANRVTSYTYDDNNRVIGVTKPDGSVTTTAYDDMQRVTSTMEKLPSGAVISGFEYTYDDLSRIIEEKVLAISTKMCYTYDELSRVTSRTIKDMSDNVLSEETFTYDAAGNLTGGSANTIFAYDTNNCLVLFNSSTVNYDFDGNMLSNGALSCTYDSANRLISAGGHTYTYNAEDVRIRNLCEDEDTTYTYNTNAKLSQLLMKTTNGVTTKYVYGRGLIGEETNNAFKTYHFDCRGSTIAITDASGNITDTFAYDTYGKQISRTGTGEVIFGYNGRDGVVTDANGLVYMRARYYSLDMRRFINADARKVADFLKFWD
ncbi:MAG: RHS repeat protein, partial [Flavobacteriales bacterium]|nr:RHS repeat protein [Flavobacteriales bacterium]